MAEMQEPMERTSPAVGRDRGEWTFLSNHSHVVICLARNPQARLRDVATAVGITERAVQKIVLELENAGVIRRYREGRRNRYHVVRDAALRHPVEAHCTVGQLLDFVLREGPE